MTIAIKRAYEEPAPTDGQRVLVDRLWPRGVSKDKAALDEWLKDIAPSNELRKWFGHEPAKFAEFKKRFIAELDANEAGWKPLLERARKGPLTLVYSAHDEAHNNAVVIKAYLEKRL
ncbi:MAG TPA: DUF488 domain-containing protein [Rhodanobacteraceae bacterium]